MPTKVSTNSCPECKDQLQHMGNLYCCPICEKNFYITEDYIPIQQVLKDLFNLNVRLDRTPSMTWGAIFNMVDSAMYKSYIEEKSKK